MTDTAEMTPLANALGRIVGEFPNDDGVIVPFEPVGRTPSKKSRKKKEADTPDEDAATAAEVARAYRVLGIENLRRLEEEGIDREAIKVVAGGLAVDLIARILGGEFRFRDAESAAKVAQIMVNIMRLESGQATAVVGVEDAEERKRKFIEMQARVRAARGELPKG